MPTADAISFAYSAGVEDFPCRLALNIPFPTTHLASIALRALSVDKELSPLVQRSFILVSSSSPSPTLAQPSACSNGSQTVHPKGDTTLQVTYRAATNRMLRVSVNGFFESLRLVIQVMQELDVDVYMEEGAEELTAVQGLGEAAVGV